MLSFPACGNAAPISWVRQQGLRSRDVTHLNYANQPKYWDRHFGRPLFKFQGFLSQAQGRACVEGINAGVSDYRFGRIVNALASGFYASVYLSIYLCALMGFFFFVKNESVLFLLDSGTWNFYNSIRLVFFR